MLKNKKMAIKEANARFINESPKWLDFMATWHVLMATKEFRRNKDVSSFGCGRRNTTKIV